MYGIRYKYLSISTYQDIVMLRISGFPSCFQFPRMFGTSESNRGAFLEATREAREERAAERRRDEAATKIQAVVRGWLVRVTHTRKIR